MTQKDKEYIKNYIKVTVIICSIILDILILINIKDIKREFTAIFDEMKSSTKVEETVEETSKENVNESTTTEIKNIVDPVEEYRTYLSEKYKSVFEWQVYSGDFGEEQLYFLEEQCVRYEVPLELMLSIICTESGFRSDAKAKTSSASGYCQIIKSTAKWIYEDKLQWGDYDVNNHVEIMTTNWRLNMIISCRLMQVLYHNNGKSWENAVKRYYGSTSASENEIYLNKVNFNMNNLFNMEISELNK
jgi:hypothetical protein